MSNNEQIKQVIDNNLNVIYPTTIADAIKMYDEYGNLTTLQAVIDAIGPISGTASGVVVADTAGYYSSGNVEGVLTELGFMLLNSAPANHSHNTLYNTKEEITNLFSTLNLTAASVENIPSGSITSENIQAALSELDTKKVSKAGDTINGNLTVVGIHSVSNGTAATQISQTSTGLVLTNSAIYGGAYRLPRIYVQTGSTAPATMQDGDILMIYTE